MTTKLRDLIRECNGTGAVIADRGNGCGYPPKGQFVQTADIRPRYAGNVAMHLLDLPHYSADGIQCHYASDWCPSGAEGHEVRFFF